MLKTIHDCVSEGGDVAFVRHTTVRENTDGRNVAEWSRNRRSDDYELLCNDGTRKNIDNWQECNLGHLPPNAVMTAGEIPLTLHVGVLTTSRCALPEVNIFFRYALISMSCQEPKT